MPMYLSLPQKKRTLKPLRLLEGRRWWYFPVRLPLRLCLCGTPSVTTFYLSLCLWTTVTRFGNQVGAVGSIHRSIVGVQTNSINKVFLRLGTLSGVTFLLERVSPRLALLQRIIRLNQKTELPKQWDSFYVSNSSLSRSVLSTGLSPLSKPQFVWTYLRVEMTDGRHTGTSSMNWKEKGYIYKKMDLL